MNKTDIEKRDSKRNIGEELLESIHQMKANKHARTHIPAIADTRHKMGLSQSDFATVLGVSTRTLQEWEQGRRHPTGAAKTLIAIAAKRPDVLLEIR